MKRKTAIVTGLIVALTGAWWAEAGPVLPRKGLAFCSRSEVNFAELTGPGR